MSQPKMRTQLEAAFGSSHREALSQEPLQPDEEDRKYAEADGEAYSDISWNLSSLARIPIVRGGKYSIDGNAGPVLRARYLMERARQDNECVGIWAEEFVCGERRTWADLKKDFKEEMTLKDPSNLSDAKNFLCPNHGKAI